MIRKVAEYTVRAGAEADAEAAIREFTGEVAAAEPETRYRAFRRGDGSDYLHLMEFADTAAEQRHRDAAYTRRFVERLYPLCLDPPRFTELAAID